MRRGASIAVLAVLLGGLLVPVVQGSAALPACCRVGGSHHCAGTNGLDGFHSEASECPYRATPAIVSGVVALVGTKVSTAMVAAKTPASSPRTSLLLSVVVGTAPQRGPPLS